MAHRSPSFVLYLSGSRLRGTQHHRIPALYLISGFFNFLGMAANSSIVAKLSSSSQRGLGYALFFLPGSLMGAVAPVIAAFIGEVFGLSSIFFASIVVYAAGLFVLWFGVKIKEP
jgi:MFS family permease